MKLAVLLSTLLAVSTAFATQGPFQPHEQTRFAALEAGTGLAAGSVTAAKLATDSVTAVKIEALAVTTAKIDALAVTDAKIAAASITESKILAQTADGLHLKRVARAVLDCGASSCVVGTVSMAIALPADALITQAYFYTVTQFVDAGSGTVALHCEDADNIFAAADITGIAVGAVTSGAPIGTAATMAAGIASACTITATIATIEQTAGVLVLFVEYTVVQ